MCIIAHLLERLKFKTLNTPCVSKDVEELEISYFPFKTVKWYHHFEKQFCGLFKKNETLIYHSIQLFQSLVFTQEKRKHMSISP